MGNTIFIKGKNVCTKSMRMRIEASQRLKPTNPKGFGSFAGVVNFLSLYCSELQKVLKPIYDVK